MKNIKQTNTPKGALEDGTPDINLHFRSKQELRNFIAMHLPIAVRPTKPAKTTFVSAFTSVNAQDVVVDALVEALFVNGMTTLSIKQDHCTCSVDETTGWTTVKCCNICGKPLKDQSWHCG